MQYFLLCQLTNSSGLCILYPVYCVLSPGPFYLFRIVACYKWLAINASCVYCLCSLACGKRIIEKGHSPDDSRVPPIWRAHHKVACGSWLSQRIKTKIPQRDPKYFNQSLRALCPFPMRNVQMDMNLFYAEIITVTFSIYHQLIFIPFVCFQEPITAPLTARMARVRTSRSTMPSPWRTTWIACRISRAGPSAWLPSPPYLAYHSYWPRAIWGRGRSRLWLDNCTKKKKLKKGHPRGENQS